MAENVTVADAIKQLRAQLEDAQREGVEKDFRFVAKSVEVELGIVFKTEVEGGRRRESLVPRHLRQGEGRR